MNLQFRRIVFTLFGFLLLQDNECFAYVSYPSITSNQKRYQTSNNKNSKRTLNMSRQRGLEILQEGATPLPGDMTLYIKAGPDGTSSVGDCPFAHYVRMVLHEKNLDYDIIPCTMETKPTWLLETYGGKMPALRHRKECYVESDIIVQYLDFFFPDPSLSIPSRKKMKEAKECIDIFFPAVVQYFKYTTTTTMTTTTDYHERDEQEIQFKNELKQVLDRLESHFTQEEDKRQGPYFVDMGKDFTYLDCSLVPKLYHLIVGLQEIKPMANIDVSKQYPKIQEYFDIVSQRPSFQKSMYSKETIVWGWNQVRKR